MPPSKNIASLALIGGGVGTFTLGLILAIVFGSSGTIVPLEIYFGMQVDLSGDIKVWARTPQSAFIQVYLGNITKKEEDGTFTNAELFDLFPMDDGEVSSGTAIASFQMYLIDESEEPAFDTEMDLVPMIYKRDVQLPAFVNAILSIAAYSLNNWGVITIGVLVKAVLLLGTGVVLLMLGMKSKKTVVERISSS